MRAKARMTNEPHSWEQRQPKEEWMARVNPYAVGLDENARFKTFFVLA
jgi:hypothetical protein